MSTHKNFAIVGAGVVGDAIVKALIENNANLIVLNRPESTTKNLPDSIRQFRVSFTDVDAVAGILAENKIEVVIATLSTFAVPVQIPLADAAKKAGVKLFVPSEFGFPPVGETVGPLGDKQRLAAHLKEISLPSVRIFVGVFSGYYPWLTQIIKDGKIHIVGSGKKSVSFTDLKDIAGFTAYVTTHLPPSELENKIFRIQGESKTLLEVAALYGGKVEIVFDEKLEDQFADGVQRVVEAGIASTGFDVAVGGIAQGENGAGSANALWAGHTWATVKESLGL